MRSRTSLPGSPEWQIALALLASLSAVAAAVSGGSVLVADARPTASTGVDPPSVASGATLQTTITDVVPADRPNETGVLPIEPGECTLVRGLTSLRGDQNTIIVELATAGNLTVVAEGETRRWETDGVWSVVFDVPANVTPGQYVVRADDGTRIARANVLVVEDRDRMTTTTAVTTDETPTTTASPTTTTASPTTTSSTTSSPTDRTTAEPTPGLGWLLAAVAVLAGVAIARSLDRSE